MSGGSSVQEITQTLDKADSERIRRVLEGGIKIPPSRAYWKNCAS